MKKYRKDTLDYYDKNSKGYYEEWNNRFINNYNFDVPDIFLKYVKPHSSILDLGCGSGRDSLYLKEKGYKVTSVDGSKEMCKIASQVLGEKVEQLEFLDMTYRDEFDAIFACASLLHLNDEDLISCLKKIVVALKDEGFLYISFKYGEGTRNKEGRFFNDMTEEKFQSIYSNIPELEHVLTFSNPIYDGHKPFINFILRKRQ